MGVALVYFIQIGQAGPVKIGHVNSDDISQRLDALQTGSPWPLRARRAIRTDEPLKVERRLHRRFVHLRMRGEWFAVDDQFEEYMESDEVFPEEPPSLLEIMDGPLPENVVSLQARRRFAL